MTPEPSQPAAKVPYGNRCLSCGFDIVGVPLGQRCPECGAVVQQFAGPGTQKQGKAIASMVLGICALVVGCMSYGLLGLPCGILAVIFAKHARVAVQAGSAPVTSLGMATAGRVCGWIGIVVSSLILLLFVLYIFAIIGLVGFGIAGGGAGPVPAPLPVGP